MSVDKQTEDCQPPFGIAGLACFGCFVVIYLATKPLVMVNEAWWGEWLFFALVLLVPISVVFTILYRSSWHRGLGRLTRILSMMLYSCILFCCVLLFGGAVITALFVVVNHFTAFHV
jgi:predicted membrane protein